MPFHGFRFRTLALALGSVVMLRDVPRTLLTSYAPEVGA